MLLKSQPRSFDTESSWNDPEQRYWLDSPRSHLFSIVQLISSAKHHLLHLSQFSLQPCSQPFKGSYSLEASVTVKFPRYVFSVDFSRTVIYWLALNLTPNNLTSDRFLVCLPYSVYLRHVLDLVAKALVSFEFFARETFLRVESTC